jgi:uridine kinase
VQVTERIADAVAKLARCSDRVLVGIDGPDAAGKSTLADRVAAALGPQRSGRTA